MEFGFLWAVAFIQAATGGKNLDDGLLQNVTYGRNETIKMSYEDVYALHHAVTFERRRWKNAVVPYVMDEAFTEKERVRIANGMMEIGHDSCIRFTTYNARIHTSYLSIIKDYEHELIARSDYGCCGSSEPSTLEFGSSRLSKEDYNVTILHELLHVLGIGHQHQRSDRNDYVKFHIENMDLNKTNLQADYWRAVEPDKTIEFVTQFDFESVMLYSPYAHSKNNEYPTISSKIVDKKMLRTSEKRHLSKGDKVLLNEFYKCADKNQADGHYSLTEEPFRPFDLSAVKFPNCTSVGGCLNDTLLNETMAAEYPVK
ncbi:low choriolytic enzyme-like [Bradysia coprophila]|uniref:low choriolytic enzyme-like n=1 Tax=Bradysia coprophila TaxID=38358 RepID=UPI00187D9BE5|nr:low choriolytic enzyme-like [Bradysia coprophila]